MFDRSVNPSSELFLPFNKVVRAEISWGQPYCIRSKHYCHYNPANTTLVSLAPRSEIPLRDISLSSSSFPINWWRGLFRLPFCTPLITKTRLTTCCRVGGSRTRYRVDYPLLPLQKESEPNTPGLRLLWPYAPTEHTIVGSPVPRQYCTGTLSPSAQGQRVPAFFLLL